MSLIRQFAIRNELIHSGFVLPNVQIFFVQKISFATFWVSINDFFTRYVGLGYSLYIYIDIYTEGYSESTEPIDAVNILPLARFEPTTSATPPSTTPDINATNCATEPSQIYIYIYIYATHT